MKICKSCGAHQSDDRNTCIDCGNVLGRPLTAEEEENLNDAISDTLTDMSDRTEDFYVSPAERVLGILCIVLAVGMLILLNICNVQKAALESELPDGTVFGELILTTDPVTGNVTASNVNPNHHKIDELDRTALYCLIAFIFHVSAGLCFLFPKAIWILETLRFRLWIDIDPSPSDYYLIVIKVFRYGFFVIGVFCSVGALVSFF